jgi:LmbE family N-acetylglucosaminyl deacetylase
MFLKVKEAKYMAKILSISIHSDDSEYAMGGTTKLLVDKGCEVTYLNIRSDLNPAKREQFDTYSKAGAALLGAKKIILDYNDSTDLYRTNEKTVRQVAQVIRDIKPDIIFMMYPSDNHIEHVECALTTRDAIFAAAVEDIYPNEIYTYECGPRQSMCYFVPDLYIGVSAAEQTLKECMVSFAAKHADGERLWREKEVEIQLRGYEKGLGLAEGFKIVKYPDDNKDFLLREILNDEFRWGGNKMYWGKGDMFL